ncbi:aminoglycoside adenylyltransferase domain-containing protein [Rossellomorea sp. LjRoot5]|uniref:aminoglycoside adenylyltransferase domain-containing protein n=1 Tax=Rossellomorea sp. LjRoot5 TaxID=3342331 RepID=UPI003ECC6899
MTNVPKIVHSVLDEYIRLFNTYLPETLEGLYLHGSVALGAFVNDSSDIDFITVTNRRLTTEDSDALNRIHTTLQQTFQKPEMDGVYILKEDIGKMDPSCKDDTEMYAYYNNGELNFGEYFNFNPITWYLVKHKEIRVVGPEISSSFSGPSAEELCQYVLQNMNTYWAGRLHSIEESVDEVKHYPTAMIDAEIEWSVLGVLRQYYTLKEASIISKQDAGQYGLQELPREWHSLIREAMNIRSGLNGFDTNSNEYRGQQTIKFLKYLIPLCNHLSNEPHIQRLDKEVKGRK